MTEPPREEKVPDEHFQILMMGFLDGELSESQEQELREHLARDPDAGKELAQYRKLGDLAQQVRLKEPQDYEWDRFWQGLYNRMERRIGWLLSMAGLLMLMLTGLIWLWNTSLLALGWKIGLGATLAGLCLLFLSVLRGRLRTLPYDRYREVQR
jgi:ferric-dicitrate binding protein FerR (iron transport regulator)